MNLLASSAWALDLAFVLRTAKERDIVIISDEIHADLTHPGTTHIPMGKANEEIGADTITFMAPSKTFNLAGEHAGFAVFSSKERFEIFQRKQRALRVTTPGYTIKQLMSAAYNDGYEYNKELCSYLEGTAEEMKAYLAKECPSLKLANAEASFVTFLDCSEVYEKIEKKVLSDPGRYALSPGGGVLSTFFGVEAGVCMNDGTWFGGEDYKAYVRFNFGCGDDLLDKGLEGIKKAYDYITKQ